MSRKLLDKINNKEIEIRSKELDFVLQHAFPVASIIKEQLGEEVLLSLMKLLGDAEIKIPSIETIQKLTKLYYEQANKKLKTVRTYRDAYNVLKNNKKEKEKTVLDFLEDLQSLSAVMKPAKPVFLDHLHSFAEDEWPGVSIYNVTGDKECGKWLLPEDYDKWIKEYNAKYYSRGEEKRRKKEQNAS